MHFLPLRNHYFFSIKSGNKILFFLFNALVWFLSHRKEKKKGGRTKKDLKLG